MNIFGVGLPEVTVILILALIIFGPKKLPELGKQLGKTLKSLKIASNEFQNEIEKVINEPNDNDSKSEAKSLNEKVNNVSETNSNMPEEEDNKSFRSDLKENKEKN